MSGNKKDELSQCVELSPNYVLPVRNAARDECLLEHEEVEDPLTFICESGVKQNPDANIVGFCKDGKQSGLSVDSAPLSTEPSSGFMLISVKRLSKVKRINRTRSASSLSAHSSHEGHVINKANIDLSPRDDGSHTTSSPMCEEEEADDFHGSGSIEAEEFEDDEVDESEGANEDDSTTIVVSTAGRVSSKSADAHRSVNSLSGPQILNISRPSRIHSGTQTLSRPDTPVGPRDQCETNLGYYTAQNRESQKIPQTLPSGFSLSACDRHLDFGQYLQESCANNPLDVFRYNSVITDHGNVPRLPSFFTSRIQTNSSHCRSEVDNDSRAINSSIHTAPVSGHASPENTLITVSTTATESLAVPNITPVCPLRPHPSTASMFYAASPSLSFAAASGAAVAASAVSGAIVTSGDLISSRITESANWSNPPGLVRPSLIHSPYNLPLSTTQPHHAFSGLPLTCPLHPHSAGSSDVRSTQTISKTESDQLTAEVVAISTASLPSLQPASRFRKARIHETVEQWCHGRLSVHDCHLKAVPDWVLDLQKKAPVLDQDISNALSQRVNCLSCLEQKVLDRTGLQQAAGTTSQKGINDAYVHSGQSKVDESYLRRVLTRGPPKNNLFSFWDGGARVYCRLPKSSRLCIPPGVSGVSNLHPQPEDGDIFIHKNLTGAGESDEMNAGPVDGSNKVLPDSTTNFNEENHMIGASIPEDVSPAPTILLPSINADPATAYLRRHQITAGVQLGYISAHQESLIKAGDSISADELSLPLSDVAQSSTGSTDYTNHSSHRELPSFQTNRVVADQYGGENSHMQEPESFLVRKRPILESLPVTVPPTSPTFMDSGLGLSYPSGMADGRHGKLATHATVNGSELTDIPPVQPKIQRIMNGEYAPSVHSGNSGVSGYHNTMPHLVANGIPDPRSDSVKPSSLSSPTVSFRSAIPYSHCSEATTLLLESVPPVTNAVNGDLGATVMSSNLHSNKSTEPYDHKAFLKRSAYISGSSRTIPPVEVSANSGVEGDQSHDTKLSDLLSSRLEARINESLDTIRMSIVSTVREELLSAYSETADLLTEVDRLKDEVIRLRGYQAAFFALRPFVSVELWEHLNTQQARLQLLQSTSSLPPGNPGTSVSGTAGPPVRTNSPQHVD